MKVSMGVFDAAKDSIIAAAAEVRPVQKASVWAENDDESVEWAVAAVSDLRVGQLRLKRVGCEREIARAGLPENDRIAGRVQLQAVRKVDSAASEESEKQETPIARRELAEECIASAPKRDWAHLVSGEIGRVRETNERRLP
jgi:hypothetical protein